MNFIEVTELLTKRPRMIAIAQIVWVEPSEHGDGARIAVASDRTFSVRDSYTEICELLKKAVSQ